jgi:hypothetical protein
VSPFASIAGDYTLTITMDEKCTQIPEPLRVRTYDVVLDGNSPGRFSPGYINVDIADDTFGGLGGELWAPRSDSRYRFEWNNFDIGGCDYPDPTTSPALYLCGDGFGVIDDTTISGVIDGNSFLGGSPPRLSCVGASHRFALVRRPR